MNAGTTTVAIQHCLDRWEDQQAREAVIKGLLERSVNRLQKLCGNMLRSGGHRVPVEADELVNEVVIRLITTLRKVQPKDARHFFALASQNIRWEFLRLARRLENPATKPLPDNLRVPDSGDSVTHATGRRVIEACESLPDDLREVFELVDRHYRGDG